jgi:hypothetical protein
MIWMKRPAITADLERGRRFVFRGPRRWLVMRPWLALGQIVGLDLARGIVHVCVYRLSESDDAPLTIEVGHLPILISALLPSIVGLGNVHDVLRQSEESIAEWRGRWAAGEVGAFSVPLLDAVQMARDTVPQDHADAPLRHALVKRCPATQEFSIVEIELYQTAVPARPPGPFKHLGANELNAIRSWLLSLPIATVVPGNEHEVEELAPFLCSFEKAWLWVRAELRALEELGQSRVEVNRGGEGPGETVHYFIEFCFDPLAGIAQLVLHLCPRDRRIGHIIVMSRIARIESDLFEIWGSGSEHAAAFD